MELVNVNSLFPFYLKRHTEINKVNYLEKFETDKINALLDSRVTVYSTVKLEFENGVEEHRQLFFHNPYVNRLWSRIVVYGYTKNRSDDLE